MREKPKEDRLPFAQLGPYVLERTLGSGGMGTVFYGVDQQSGKHAAVKLLAQSLAADESFRQRFGAEIETLKQLKHPNIVELFGYGEQAGYLFYAMEMVDGRSLQGELQAGHRFDWQATARIGVEICQALKHAHDRGIIHRDLKLANLLYSEDEHIKLADFGIAKLYGMAQLTAAGGVLGTADYMAPEQAESKPVTARGDLYSLGSVLFALLTGRPPFVACSVPEVLRKLTSEEAPPVRRFAPNTPREFELIIAQLLSKDPQQRIATALATGNRLKAMAYGLSLETRIGDGLGEGCSEQQSVPLSADESVGLPIALPDSLTRGADSAIRNVEFVEGSVDHHEESTVAASDLFPAVSRDSAAGLQEHGDLGGTHFTPYDEEARQHATHLSTPEDTTPLWVKVAPAILGAMAILAVVWYATRPVTADALYQQIMAVAETPDTRRLATVETEMVQFLDQFAGDVRSSEIRSLREELQLYRLERRYRRRARLRSGVDSMEVPERAYVDAIRVAEDDPYEAITKLKALLDVYSGVEIDDDTAQCLRLAREQMASIEERAATITEENLAVINQRLDAADQLAAENNDQATVIRRGVIALYENERWAKSVVLRARQSLE